MKRSVAIIAAAVLAFAPAIASAQVYQEEPDTVDHDRGWGFGIKGGVSWNNVSNSGVFPGELSQYTGWTIGLGFGTTGTPVSIGIEALWARRGITSSQVADSRHSDYVDVPAFLRLAIPASVVAPYIFAGPQVSWEVTCATTNGDCSDTDRADMSYAAIVGAGIRLGEDARFSVEGRYMYGLTDFRPSTVSSSDSYRQRAFMILGGIGF
jgi:opacity protein-like surface antigen